LEHMELANPLVQIRDFDHRFMAGLDTASVFGFCVIRSLNSSLNARWRAPFPIYGSSWTSKNNQKVKKGNDKISLAAKAHPLRICQDGLVCLEQVEQRNDHTRDVSLKAEIRMLTLGGITIFRACGRIISLIVR